MKTTNFSIGIDRGYLTSKIKSKDKGAVIPFYVKYCALISVGVGVLIFLIALLTMFVHFQPKLDNLNKQVNDLNDIISLMKEEHLTFVSTFKTDNQEFNN